MLHFVFCLRRKATSGLLRQKSALCNDSDESKLKRNGRRGESSCYLPLISQETYVYMAA